MKGPSQLFAVEFVYRTLVLKNLQLYNFKFFLCVLKNNAVLLLCRYSVHCFAFLSLNHCYGEFLYYLLK